MVVDSAPVPTCTVAEAGVRANGTVDAVHLDFEHGHQLHVAVGGRLVVGDAGIGQIGKGRRS